MRMKVYSQGGSFIGVLPRAVYRRSCNLLSKNDPKIVAFKRYLKEATAQGLKGEDLAEYLFCQMLNDDNASYLLDDVEINDLLKKDKNRIHQRVKRYNRKLGFFRPNYFITFTYVIFT